jgi:tRNA(fMet)-specific endonuclease VapC
MLSRLLSDYAAVSTLPFDAAAATVFDGLLTRRVRIGTMDLRIASIALAHGLTLVTRNARDFQQVPGLLIEDWIT